MKKYYIRVIGNNRFLLEWNGAKNHHGELILNCVKNRNCTKLNYKIHDLIEISDEEAMLELL